MKHGGINLEESGDYNIIETSEDLQPIQMSKKLKNNSILTDGALSSDTEVGSMRGVYTGG